MADVNIPGLDELSTLADADAFEVYDDDEAGSEKNKHVLWGTIKSAARADAGGASISDAWLKRLCLGRQYTLSSITRSSGLVTGGSGTFADGSALTYTVTRSSGLVATEVFAHAASGKALTITYSRTSGLVSSFGVAIT